MIKSQTRYGKENVFETVICPGDSHPYVVLPMRVRPLTAVDFTLVVQASADRLQLLPTLCMDRWRGPLNVVVYRHLPYFLRRASAPTPDPAISHAASNASK